MASYCAGILLWFSLLTTVCSGQRLETFKSRYGRVSKILLDPTGNVFVGGLNTIYQFADESVSEENLEVILDTRPLQSSRPNAPEPETKTEINMANNVSLLMMIEHNAVQPTQRLLLACGTVGYGMCDVFDVRNISNNWPIVPPDTNDVEAALGSRTSAVAVQAPGPFFFSAINDVGMNMTNVTFTFSMRTFSEESGTYKMHYERHFDADRYYITTKPGVDFRFLHGQYFNGQIYIMRNTMADHMSEAYMSQMCAADLYFRSYIESKIHCGEYVVAEAVTVYNFSDTTYLVTTFSSRLHPGSALCLFNMSTIESHFKDARKDCFKQKIGQWPNWIEDNGSSCNVVVNRTKIECGYTFHNKRIATKTVITAKPVRINSTGLMTSLAMTTVDYTPVGYLGHADGSITKIMFDSRLTTTHVIYTVTVTDNEPIDPDMVINDNGEKLFFTHSDKVSMLMTENCSLVESCSNCLAGNLPCVWIGRCVHSSYLSNSVTSDLVYSDFCPPEIYSVSPLNGPFEGGTNITVTGNFGTAGSKLTIMVGGVSSEYVVQESPGSFNVTTSEVPVGSDGVNITVSVLPGATNVQYNTWTTSINGTVQFSTPFVYKKSVIDAKPRKRYYAKVSGNIRINMTGTDLDIGRNRIITLGQMSCLNDSYSATWISCRAPAQSSPGNLTSTLYIDNQVTPGPDVIYLPDPVITKVTPRLIIRSGGIPVTFSGTNLRGLGNFLYIASSLNNSHDTPGSRNCAIKMTNMECLVPEYAKSVTSSPVTFYNEYGTVNITFSNSSLSMFTIVENPAVEVLGDITLEDGQLVDLKGRYFNNVDVRHIKVMIGVTSCHIESRTDTLITCTAGRVEEDVLLLPVKVHFGRSLVYHVGNAVYGARVAQTSVTSEEGIGMNEMAIIVVVLAGLVIVGIVAAFIFRRMRTKLRTMNGESYNVIFTRDREALAVADLSERDTSDAAQNRQNLYQEQTFMKAADDNAGKDVEPLLPAFDEDVRASLERQNLFVDRNHLVLGEVIGQGHFGCVYKGYLQKPDEKEETIVAAKTLHRSNPKDMDIEQFLKEALIMKDFHHRNVMELVGICLGLKKLPLVVLPFMRRGDLLTYIRDVNNVPTVKKLVEFGIDIANGMHYLSQLKFVHRDLAARNCMIDEDYVVKVADFGLSRDVYEKEYYSTCDKKTMLPVKWMSPESLEIGLFNYKTDIWSFGVVLWELLTRGMVPYPTVDNWDMLRFLNSGRRMPKPDYCPEGMYRIMQRCWAWKPEERPSFGELTIEIPQLLRRLERSSSERSRSTTTDEFSDRSSSRAASECK